MSAESLQHSGSACPSQDAACMERSADDMGFPKARKRQSRQSRLSILERSSSAELANSQDVSKSDDHALECSSPKPPEIGSRRDDRTVTANDESLLMQGALDCELLDAAGEWCQAESAARKAPNDEQVDNSGHSKVGAGANPETSCSAAVQSGKMPQAPAWARWADEGSRCGAALEERPDGVDHWASTPGASFEYIGIGFKELAEGPDEQDETSTSPDCGPSEASASDDEHVDGGERADVVIGFRADIGEGDGLPNDPEESETEVQASELDDAKVGSEFEGNGGADKGEDADTDGNWSGIWHNGPRNAGERIAHLVLGRPLPKVTHILFIVHGMGATDEGLQKNVENLGDSLREMQKYWFWHTNIEVHVEMINWKAALGSHQTRIFDRITPAEARNTRDTLNWTLSDALFYKTAHHRSKIYEIVTRKMNTGLRILRADASGRFADARISVVGHSLGSVIAYDVLTGFPGPDYHPDTEMPKLEFQVDTFFLWGSPLAAFVSIADIEFQHGKFILPDTLKMCNIFHPHDPVAFRIEPLYYHTQEQIPPEMIAHWVNNGFRSSKQWARSYEYAKGLAVQKWTALKSRVCEAIGTSSEADLTRQQWQTYLESDQDLSTLVFQPNGIARDGEFDGEETLLTPKMRLDYVLQEHAGEALIESYGMLQSHFCYWTSRDVALLMLKKMSQQETAELNAADRERADLVERAAEAARLEEERRVLRGESEPQPAAGAWALFPSFPLSSDDIARGLGAVPCVGPGRKQEMSWDYGSERVAAETRVAAIVAAVGDRSSAPDAAVGDAEKSIDN